MLEHFDRQNEIRELEACFPKGTPDIQWIPEVASWDPQPTVVCGDGRILKNRAELAALRDANLMFVYLASGWTNLAWADFAWKIVKVWPDIVRNVEKTRKPTIFEVAVRTLKVARIGLVSEIGR